MPCNGDPDSVCPEIVRNEDFLGSLQRNAVEKSLSAVLVRIKRQHKTHPLPCAKITDL